MTGRSFPGSPPSGFLGATKVNRLVKVIAGAVLIYAAYCALLFVMQRHMIFPRYMIPAPPPPDVETLRIEPWWLETSFGKVEAWYLPPAASGKPAPAVIFGHGNGELIDYWPDELGRFASMGVGLLLVEYPGYGRSDGAPSQVSSTPAPAMRKKPVATRRSTFS